MKVTNKRWHWVFFAILLPAMAVAQDTARVATRHQLTIKQAIDYANAHNVQVKNALIDVLQQKETNRQVTAAALPSISASGSFTNNLELMKTLVPADFAGGPPGTFVAVPFGTKYVTAGSVDLNQILFDGQVFVGLQARRTSLDWANKNVEVTQQMIKANIYKVYYQLVASRTQVDLLDSNISLLAKQQHDARIMFENGFAEKLDVDRATVGIANLQAEKERVLTTINNGYFGLKLLLGMPMSDELVLTDTLSEQQLVSNVIDNSNYQYEDRKDYQYLQLSRDLNAFNIRRYKLSKLPTFSLNASYMQQLMKEELKFDNPWFSASYFSLRLSLPIFNGFATNSKIEAARLTVRQLDNEIENMKISIDNDVIVARNAFTTAITVMETQKQNMQLAETVYQQTKKKYEVGTGSSTDLTSAQKDLQQAQTNYINALYGAIIAKVDYFNATGKL